MNKNKKLIIVALLLLAAVFAVMSACKKNSANGGEVVVVTDQNGVPVTDENGEAITVVLETEIVEVTNANGEKVYDENGEVKTSVVYKSKDVAIPLTDKNGEVIRDSDGKVITTMITVPPATGGPAVTKVPLTDSQGNYVTDANGETVTYTLTYVTTPATPGDNSSNWGTTFGGSGNDSYKATAATPDGGSVALFQSNSTDGTVQGLTENASVPFMVLMKYNSSGKLQWQKAIYGNGSLVLNSIDVDASGNIIAAGYTNANNLGVSNYGDYDGIIYKFNSAGDIQWTQSFGGTLTDGFYGITVCPDGSIAAAGFSASNNGNAAGLGLEIGKSSAFVVKYDANGNTSYMKSFGSTGDSFTAIDCDPNGNLYILGNFSSSDAKSLFTSYGKADAGIVKLNSNGDQLWVQHYGGSRIENFAGITATSDGCVIVGRTQSNDNNLASLGNQGGYDAVIVKFDSNGGLSWETAFRGYYDDSFSSVKQTADGSFVACGYSFSGNRDLKTVGNRGACDAIVVTFTSSGQIASAQGYGGTGEDKFESICVLSSGEYIACGSTLSVDGDLVGSKAQSDGSHTVGMIARFK